MSIPRVLAMVALVLMAAGCGAASRPPSEPRATLPHTLPHPADRFAAARRLPAHTLAFVAVEQPLALLARFEPALSSAWLEPYERLRYEMLRELGHDLLSRAGWTELGLDPRGAVGAALLGLDELALVLPLGDAARFKGALYRVAMGQAGGLTLDPPAAVGEAVVIAGDGLTVVVHPDSALVLAGRAAETRAERLARLHPDDSLAAHPPFRAVARRSVARRSGRAAIAGYLDLRGLVYARAGLDPRWGGADRRQAERRLEQAHSAALARARRRGAAVAEIVDIEARFAEARRALREEDAEAAGALRKAAGAIEGAGFALTIEPSRATLTAHAELARESLPWRLIRGAQGSGAPPIARSLAAEPAALLHLALEPGALLELGALFGSTPEALSKGLGVDVSRDLLPLFTGEIGVAVGAPHGAARALSRPEELSLSALVSTPAPRRALGLVDRLAEGSLLGSFLDKQEGTRIAEVPGLSPLELATGPGRLALSNDRAWLRSLGARGARDARGPRREPSALLRGPAAVALDVDLSFLWLGTRAHPPAAVAAREPYRDPEVPISAAYRDKLSEIAALDRQIAEAERDAERDRLLALQADAPPPGRLTVRLAPAEHGAVLEAELRTGGAPLAEVIAGLARASAGSESERRFAAEELFERRRKLADELDAIYEREVEAFFRERR